jgi:hypothetical protein
MCLDHLFTSIGASQRKLVPLHLCLPAHRSLVVTYHCCPPSPTAPCVIV